MKKIPLQKETVLRVRQGHPWIYRSELSRLPEDLLPGEPVEWVDSKGRFVGIGYCNPKSVITGRLFSQEQEKIDPSFFEKRIIAALSFRKRFYPNEEAYRVVNGEADFLPGLVIDRYGENIVVQILTAGMEWHKEVIVAAIDSVFSPKAIIARNDPSSRTLEGLPVEKKILSGSFAPPVVMIKNGLSFEVDLLEGQKTGFFLDQSENYLSLKGLVSGGAVLDAFCYTGGWSLHAARFGAKSVIGIDA
ncbi:MAG: class I SAM-dependent methyltransferase, partial [Candidatus Manganitrophaceae bacterium]